MKRIQLPESRVPESMLREEMPDLLRHWYLSLEAVAERIPGIRGLAANSCFVSLKPAR
jgi:hypothetical protein